MAIENHPKYDEWRAASEDLLAAQLAQQRGDASMLDISVAQMKLNRIRDEIDNE